MTKMPGAFAPGQLVERIPSGFFANLPSKLQMKFL
jgi:hypothetical protein